MVTTFDYPLIPQRGWDWSAIDDDYELGDPIGRGPNEQAAIVDLQEQLQEQKA